MEINERALLKKKNESLSFFLRIFSFKLYFLFFFGFFCSKTIQIFRAEKCHRCLQLLEDPRLCKMDTALSSNIQTHIHPIKMIMIETDVYLQEHRIDHTLYSPSMECLEPYF